ncbi:arsenate reductase family protein [Actibacterium ureilyticum]|uniref:arsenate reductase family protein n=1 Tax=Actibacterium ureilyticum TaxID=1590614 RepID=UPI000BAAF912|nr:ArsC/Spx/MgsR family protein [Actibacterium ureilyticum]
MKLYGLKTCDTCRKALKALEQAGTPATFVDVRADGITAAERAEFLSAFGAALINTRSTTWRGLDADERARAPEALLESHPTLMKRPVIRAGEALYLGWGKDTQAALLG